MHAEFLEYGDVLRNDADFSLHVVARLRHGLSEQANLSAIVGKQLEYAVDGGGLAAAVWPE